MANRHGRFTKKRGPNLRTPVRWRLVTDDSRRNGGRTAGPRSGGESSRTIHEGTGADPRPSRRGESSLTIHEGLSLTITRERGPGLIPGSGFPARRLAGAAERPLDSVRASPDDSIRPTSTCTSSVPSRTSTRACTSGRPATTLSEYLDQIVDGAPVGLAERPRQAQPAGSVSSRWCARRTGPRAQRRRSPRAVTTAPAATVPATDRSPGRGSRSRPWRARAW